MIYKEAELKINPEAGGKSRSQRLTLIIRDPVVPI